MDRPSESLTQDSQQLADGASAWALVRGKGTDGEEIVQVFPAPFRIGRRPGSSLQLNSKTISGHHAELTIRDNQLWAEDLGSTNGTYVNGRKIEQRTALAEEDLLQFADIAFRVKQERRDTTTATMHEDMCDNALALVQFDRLMENRLVTPFFQPIVNLKRGTFIGYEVLARSSLFGMESCAAMFDAAARLNMEVDLSRMLRWEGVREGLGLPNDAILFVNTHPSEIRVDGLIDSMAAVRRLSSDVPLVLEVHEAAVTDPRQMQDLRNELKDLNVGLAYDDFGAGQTRLSELIEAPPDFLKFDISLIRGIDSASPEHQRTLHSLVQVALDLGVNPLAEGVETPAEADTCRSMGFLSAQGYHFGRPAPLRKYATA